MESPPSHAREGRKREPALCASYSGAGGQDPAKAAPNHSPEFFVDEAALIVGVRALSRVTANYLAAPKEN
jgi:metal-dependent amidase/aminoacylase/carboxypeptidase family protein